MKKLLLMFGIVAVSVLLIKCGNNSEEPKATTKNDTVLQDSLTYNKYLKKGSEFAMNTGSVLIKNVTETIQKKGTVHAIEFCNTKALPLTDSISTVQNTFIKRVTDRGQGTRVIKLMLSNCNTFNS